VFCAKGYPAFTLLTKEQLMLYLYIIEVIISIAGTWLCGAAMHSGHMDQSLGFVLQIAFLASAIFAAYEMLKPRR
jgi:hypothetical protein